MKFNNWNEINFGEICNYKTGRKNSNAAENNGKYPFFTCSPQTMRINSYAFNQEAVLLAGNNANGVFPIKKYNGKFDAYQRTYVISSNDTNVIDNTYLYYYLMYKLNFIKEMSIGSATKYLTKKILDKLIIQYPNNHQMKEIGKILNVIDKKIELNNSIINNLEELSQTLFKRWFVDFEFPDEDGNPYKSNGGKMAESELGFIPEGWEIKSLSGIANFQNGLAMQKYRPEENEVSLPVLKIKELRQGFTDENSDLCSNNIKDSVRISDGDVIFSWSASLLVKLWSGGTAGLNQHLFKVTSISFSKWFYYLWTKHHLEQFNAIARDKATTMGHIKRSHLEESRVLVPSDRLLEYFSLFFEPLINKKINIAEENKSLSALRDTLLPKLLSGEIEAPEEMEVTDDVSIS